VIAGIFLDVKGENAKMGYLQVWPHLEWVMAQVE
jgi:hypothetical protein